MIELPRNGPSHLAASDARFALWNLGFRPFYLLASLFSAFSVLLWVAQYSGLPTPVYRHGPVWHAHEMLFGYTTAVIAGFLLTAVRNWTNQPTPTGVWLMALVMLCFHHRECGVSHRNRNCYRHSITESAQYP